jgi:hypothetical protein
MGNSRLTDRKIEQMVKRQPGLSLYQLKLRTGWSIGKVDGAVSRLVNAQRLFVVVGEGSGRTRSRVFPPEYLPTPRISVPKDLLQMSRMCWNTFAYVYALDNLTIGITGRPMPDWKRAALFSHRVPITRTKKHIHITVPTKLTNFYMLKTHFLSKSVSSNGILIVVGSSIQQHRRYPNHQ